MSTARRTTDGGRERPRPEWGAALEAGALLTLVVLDIWFVEPSVRGAWVALLAFVIVSHWRRGETPAALGFRRANLRRCLAAVAPILLGAAALALVLGRTFGTIRPVTSRGFAALVTSYCVWGLFQQYALNAYFVNRFAAAAPGRRLRFVPPVAAGCFALAHIPNWFLVGVTFAAGLLCARFYLRYRNLYPLGVAHGLLGAVLFVTVPDTISWHFHVGPGMWRWQQAHPALAGRPPACPAAVDTARRAGFTLSSCRARGCRCRSSLSP